MDDHQEEQTFQDNIHHSWAVPEGQFSKNTMTDTLEDI